MKLPNPHVLASWPAPNYENPQSRGYQLFFTNGIFFFFATIALLLRLYARIFVRKWVGLDDYLIIAAYLCNAGDLSIEFMGNISLGWDRHLRDARLEWFTPGTKLVFAAKLLWSCSSALVRLSILCLFYRLLNHIELRRYRWVLHCMLFLVLGILAGYFGTTIFACIPVSSYFKWPSPGKCMDEGMSITILSALNTFSEFVVAMLPVAVIVRFHANLIKSWRIICLLSLGVLVSIVGAVRTYYVWIAFSSADLTWWSTPHWICSEVELCVGLICACVPSIWPLLNRMLSKWMPNRTTDPVNSSFFGSKGSPPSTNLDKSRTSFQQKDPFLWRPFDLEGIRDDGIGYTVTISGGSPKTGRDYRHWFGSNNEDKTSEEREKGRGYEFMRCDLAAAWPFKHSRKSRRNSQIDAKAHNSNLRIITTNKLEVIESYDEKGQKNSVGVEDQDSEFPKVLVEESISPLGSQRSEDRSVFGRDSSRISSRNSRLC